MTELQERLKGKNLAQVARVAGVSRETVCRYANGATPMRVGSAEPIIEAALDIIDRQPTRGQLPLNGSKKAAVKQLVEKVSDMVDRYERDSFRGTSFEWQDLVDLSKRVKGCKDGMVA